MKAFDEEKRKIDILFSDFPEIAPIDDTVRAKNSIRVFTGGVRINSAKYRTVEEDKAYRAESLSRALP